MNSYKDIDWQSIREKFPVTGNYTYLNTASSGAIATTTAKKVSGFYEDQLNHAAINRSGWLDAIASARIRSAELLGTSSDHIGFTTDVSAGMNFVADRVSEDKEIVLIKGDFPSVNIPWVTRDFKIKWVGKESDHTISMDKIKEAIGEGSKVVAISWVQYSSGFTIDLKKLSELCNSSNTLLIVDGTQAVGCLPIRLDELNIDVMIASSFKWQGAGYGICLYYENPKSKFTHPIKLAGWNSLKRFSGELTPENLKTNAPAIEAGHAKYASLVALDAGLKFMQDIGLENIYTRNQELKNLLVDKLKATRVVFHSPILANNYSTIVCVKASDQLFEAMEKEQVKVTRRDDYIRLSVHFYNNEVDIEKAITIIEKHMN